MNDTTRGRPRGEVRAALVPMLRDGPAHPAALAQRGDLDVMRVRATLNNMQRRGEAVVVDRIVVPGANRPASVYALANSCAAVSRFDLVRCWAAWPAEAETC